MIRFLSRVCDLSSCLSVSSSVYHFLFFGVSGPCQPARDFKVNPIHHLPSENKLGNSTKRSDVRTSSSTAVIPDEKEHLSLVFVWKEEESENGGVGDFVIGSLAMQLQE